MEQASIAVVERIGRELVQLEFNAAASRQSAAAIGPESALDPGASSAEGEPQPDAQLVAETRSERPLPAPTPRTIPAAVLPWLGGLTLAVLYLLAKTFF